MEPLITEFELADWLRQRVTWIKRQRKRGWGPPYVRVGRSIRYRREDIETWVQSQRIGKDTRTATESSPPTRDGRG